MTDDELRRVADEMTEAINAAFAPIGEVVRSWAASPETQRLLAAIEACSRQPDDADIVAADDTDAWL